MERTLTPNENEIIAKLLRHDKLSIDIIAHDIKNPLHAIKLGCGIIRRSSTDRKILSLVSTMENAANSINFLISNFADSVTLGIRTYMSVNASVTACSDIMSEVCSIMAPIAESRHVRLHLNKCSDSAKVACDKNRVIQLLHNLIGNAVKFTPSGGTVTLSCIESDRHVTFSVEDTGCGIKLESSKHIFQPYWKDGDSSQAGDGLGLAIVKMIAEAHGGNVSLTHTGPGGSRFDFVLPKQNSV